MRKVFMLMACSFFLNMSIIQAQTTIQDVPPLQATPIQVTCVAPAPVALNLDQIIAAIADLKATMTQQHNDQTTFWKQFSDFFKSNWPTITAAFGAYLTCHASGKC